MLSRWLARVVLGAATTMSVLVGIAGARLMLEPPPPGSLTELTERIEAAGIRCGGVTTADVDRSMLVCGDGPAAMSVSCYHRLPTVGISGSYVPLAALGAERAELSGDRFVVRGPYETLRRVQGRLGGRLQRLSSGR